MSNQLALFLYGEEGEMKLTEKQQRFADYYVELGNATQAAIKAGYAKKTAASIGAENLRKPHIKAYIDEQLEKLKSKRIADSQEVLEFLTSVMRDEQNEETLIGTGKGAQAVVEIKLPGQARIKAAELLGKRYLLFSDRPQDKGETEAQVASEKFDELIRETAKARLDLQASAGDE